MPVGSIAGALNVSNRDIPSRVSYLSKLSTNLGNITAGDIRGVTIRGSTFIGNTFKTAGAGARVVIDATGIHGYNASGGVEFDLNTTQWSTYTILAKIIKGAADGVDVRTNNGQHSTVWDQANNQIIDRISGNAIFSSTTGGVKMHVSAAKMMLTSSLTMTDGGNTTDYILFDTNGITLKSGRYLRFVDSTSSNSMFKPNGTEIQARKADDSAFANFKAENIVANGVISASNLTSGTYTPTATGINNIDSLTPDVHQYLRVGNTITVSGQTSVNPTTAGNYTEFRLSLPFATNFSNSTEAGGGGGFINLDNNGWCGAYADAGSDEVVIFGFPNSGASQLCSYSFTYRLI